MTTLYSTKEQAINFFNIRTSQLDEVIQENFMIVSGAYIIQTYTEAAVYTVTIDVRSNQLRGDRYCKATDIAISTYHNTRVGVTRQLVELFNQLKIERMGY